VNMTFSILAVEHGRAVAYLKLMILRLSHSGESRNPGMY
jgi:hypothetical protein